MDCVLDGRGWILGKVNQFFCPPQYPERLWGPMSPIQPLLESLSQGVKRPGREANYSPPSSIGAKNNGANISPVHLHGVMLNYE
jgi:hypothetical protein